MCEIAVEMHSTRATKTSVHMEEKHRDVFIESKTYVCIVNQQVKQMAKPGYLALTDQRVDWRSDYVLSVRCRF